MLFVQTHPTRKYCRDCWFEMTGIKHHGSWSSSSEEEDEDMGEDEGGEEEPMSLPAVAQQSPTAGTHADAQAEMPQLAPTHTLIPGRAAQVAAHKFSCPMHHDTGLACTARLFNVIQSPKTSEVLGARWSQRTHLATARK